MVFLVTDVESFWAVTEENVSIYHLCVVVFYVNKFCKKSL